ncbi:serine/threonine-protein kinase [Actinomycetospora sp. NBRC 106378]|uniref:serine/threonine-protein kinase n=1 Tax=Actinomycetospora sp. NBRC 106378 TaxID=3032208 RepID=UPI0024A13D9E|nr:serine/threonine-protein kinase [Actinomycetospora sp. NBRC 106378]GLZ52040.1 serine/threonine protein kinase [Actinomycetospora sp. NBRC 106378]
MTTVGVPTLPTRLSARYEAGPVLGRGVGSVVIRAHDTLLGRDAAVKIFRVESDPRAGRELSLLARFDHPGLVPVYDVEEHDGRAFVVMALLDGGSLVSRLAAGDEGLGLADALRTAATVGGALDHLHRAGVTHRGVTPANVLYDGDGRAHLADFGVALVADAPRITDTGLTVGAAPYLAPEQVRGEPAGAGADVYALGLVLIEALTGRRAFPGDPLSAAQARLDRGPVLPDGLSPDLADLLTGMTATDPAERPDAATASGTLRRALVEAEPPTAALLTTSHARTVHAVGPAATTGLGVLTGVGGAAARRSPDARRGTPRATGTRGVLVLAGLAASAVLAGTVAIASSGPVAEVSADDRPSVVAGGATVGAPDTGAPAFVLPAPAPSSSPAGQETDEAPATATTEAPASEPVRRAASPSPEPSRSPQPTQPTRTAPTHGTTAEPTAPEPTSPGPDDDTADATGGAGGSDGSAATPTRRPGAVGEVLQGVGGLLGGALGGGR